MGPIWVLNTFEPLIYTRSSRILEHDITSYFIQTHKSFLSNNVVSKNDNNNHRNNKFTGKNTLIVTILIFIAPIWDPYGTHMGSTVKHVCQNPHIQRSFAIVKR